MSQAESLSRGQGATLPAPTERHAGRTPFRLSIVSNDYHQMQVDPIYIDDRAHTFWQWCITTNFRLSYRRLRILGLENIPTEGAVIFAPNHCNALCDALAVVALNCDKKVFAARADIFRNPTAAKLLRFHRIMPIRRIRDGLDEVRKNDETINEAVDTLLHGCAFCIMPEGTHRPRHSLLPLSKGIFRIAIETHKRASAQINVSSANKRDSSPINMRSIYIVPIGLEYGDYFHLYDSLLVQVGEPINVTDYLREHAEFTEPQQILGLREILTERMRRLILWVPDDANYEQNWAALRQNMPSPWREMQARLWPRALRMLLLVLTAPLALLGFSLTIPYWLTTIIVRHTVKDPAFYNSVQQVIQLLLMVLTLGIGSIIWRATSEWLWHLRHIKN